MRSLLRGEPDTVIHCAGPLIIAGMILRFVSSRSTASSKSLMNSIANLKTVNLQSPAGPLTAIMIGVNISDVQTADAFIAEVAEKFKVQRMISPPDTGGLLITVIGDLPVVRFATRWRELMANDQALAFFMSQMRVADVVRGLPSGQPLEKASLLPGSSA